MTRRDRAIGLAVALAVTTGIEWASNAKLTPPTAGADAMLRLAWSARPRRVEDCRPQSEEALARLPAHMRQPIVCEGVSAVYRLDVRHEGTVIAEQSVQGGGLRRDRPLYVFREIALPAGESTISVRFTRVDTATTNDTDDQPARGGRPSSDVPELLMLERRFHFRPGRVILVTYDPDRQELVAVGETPR